MPGRGRGVDEDVETKDEKDMTERTAHRVVVIGSGFGGLFGTAALKRRDDVEITLIARTSHHLFQPLLYQVATGILSEGEIAPSTREILARQRNARVLLGTVTHIDLEARTVTSQVLGRETVTPYDSLLVAAGSGQSYFGNDAFAEHAPGMKSIDDALELRGRIFGAFEIAELTEDRAEAERYLTFVVVGAGPTGVEMAGQIAELSRRTIRRDFRTIDPARARVVLVDAVDTVLPTFGERLGGKAARRLGEMGVEIRLGAKVVDVDATGVVVEEDGQRHRIEAMTKVWAAGVRASSLGRIIAEQSDCDVDRAGRVGVNPDLTVPGHPEVFVVGDMIDLDGLPGSGPGGHPGRPVRRGPDHAASRRQGARRPLRVPRQGIDGDDLAVQRRREHRTTPLRRLRRLAALARGPPRLHRRVQAPRHDPAALGHQLRRPGPGGAHHHRAAGVRPPRHPPPRPLRAAGPARHRPTELRGAPGRPAARHTGSIHAPGP